MIINVLGSAGWMPSYGRETACLMLRGENTLLLLDAGTGVSNLNHYEELLIEYDTVYVFLSHYHLDHIIGISYLNKWFKNKNVVFLVPEPKGDGRAPVEILNDLINPEIFSLSLNEIASSIEIIEYQEYVPFVTGEFTLVTKEQEHSSPSYAVKVDNKICYATDTVADCSIIKWAHDVEAIFHECWSADKDDSSHTSYEELLDSVKYLENGKLYLIHHNPDISIQTYKNLCDSVPNILVAEDLMEIVL